MTRRLAVWIGVLAAGLAAGLVALPAPGAGAPAPHPKRGVASAHYLLHDPARLVALGATWAYDWSATAPPAARGLEWVPMMWGPGSVTPGSLAALTRLRRAGRVRDLLGFNEPDSGSQANLSPGRAAALWPSLERTGLQLGSPAPAVPGDGWLARFMSLARTRHLRVDFIALHFYPDYTNSDAVAGLRRELVGLHTRYRLPLWITEIGALDIARWGEPMAHPPSAAAAADFERRLFAMLDELPFVQRYAWFTDLCWNDPGCRASSLFDARGRPTDAGRAFRRAG